MREEVDIICYNVVQQKVFANQLQAESTGGVWYVAGFSSPETEVKGIGLFYFDCSHDDPELKNLLHLAESGWLVPENQESELMLEPPPKTIVIGNNKKSKIIPSDSDGNFLPLIRDVELLLTRLAVRTCEYPLASLGLALHIGMTHAAPGANISLEFDFVNQGIMELKLMNPRWISDNVSAELVVEFWKRAGPNDWEDLSLRLDVSKHELLIGPRHAVATDKQYLVLGPGQHFVAVMTIPCPRLQVGQYDVRAIYRAISDEPQRGVVTGLLFSPNSLIHILP